MVTITVKLEDYKILLNIELTKGQRSLTHFHRQNGGGFLEPLTSEKLCFKTSISYSGKTHLNCEWSND